MTKIIFNDNMDIVVYENGKITTHKCDFYNNYVANGIRQTEKDAWKTQGFGAQFRGDAITDLQMERQNRLPTAYFSNITFTKNSDEIIYSLIVDNISAVMKKDLTTDKSSESHIIHSNENIFLSTNLSNDGTNFVTCIKPDNFTSHLGIYNLNSSDYYTFTDGDSFDFNAIYDPLDNERILFASKGVGRDINGNFGGYSNSEIYIFNTSNNEITSILKHKTDSYYLPKRGTNGSLYAIKKIENNNNFNIGGFLFDIVTIPIKLVMALYYFLEAFTTIFTGKSFTEKSSNPAKSNDKSPRKIFIEGNIIEAENQKKSKEKHSSQPIGIASNDYQLVKVHENIITVLAKGVVAYDLLDDDQVVYTNGKGIFLIDKDLKTTKLAKTSLTTVISCYKQN